MSAQRYTQPQSLRWMSEGLCPECGEPSARHLDDPRFWLPRQCDLMPSGVVDRIAQYEEDLARRGVNR